MDGAALGRYDCPMHDFLRGSLTALTLGITLVAMASCSAPLPPTEGDLATAGSSYFEDENYIQAIVSYEKLLEQFPFSDEAELAALNIAHAYYLTKQYDKAIASFEELERLYPTSMILPFVEYTVGMCYLDRSLTGDRDTSASENALRQFERLQSRFPSSIYAPLASLRAAQAREYLAEHELYVGKWYLKIEKLDAAQSRLETVLREYPDTDAAEEARIALSAL
ncbi:MAG: outer membrane protein assembly factor BamD [Hyphomicrobiaceae bacterium]|jgi:outer membrane protein assembly factor BamD